MQDSTLQPGNFHPGSVTTTDHFAWWRWIGRFSVMVAVLCLVPISASSQTLFQFRVGFSSSLLGNMNQNDVMAALRVWAQVIAQESGIPADPQSILFHNTAEIESALTNNAVDCINLTTAEYVAIRRQVAQDRIVAAVISDSIMEEYVLLVHRASGIQNLSDLRGRTLGMLQSARASLAPVWLDTLLAEDGLGRAVDFFGPIALATKVGKAVLPAFFRQTDACVVTRSGFETMVELNPQTGQRLKILATSAPVVPAIFCFRAGFTTPFGNQLMDQIKRSHLSPAGRQILTIFQTERLEEHPVSCLDSALDLLTAYARLSGDSITSLGGKPSNEAMEGRIKCKSDT